MSYKFGAGIQAIGLTSGHDRKCFTIPRLMLPITFNTVQGHIMSVS